MRVSWGTNDRALVVIALSPNSTDIMEEQAEQVERFEMLLIEFEKKVEELGVSFMEFLVVLGRLYEGDLARRKSPSTKRSWRVLKSCCVEIVAGLFDRSTKVMATDEGSFLRIVLVSRRGPFVEQLSVLVHQRPISRPGA